MRLLVFGLFFTLMSSLLFAGRQEMFSVGMTEHQSMDPSCAVHCFLEQADDGYVNPIIVNVLTALFAVAIPIFLFQPLRLVLRERTLPLRAYRDPLSLLTIMKRE